MKLKQLTLLTASLIMILGSVSCYSDRDPHYGAKTYKVGHSTRFDSVVHTADGGFVTAGTANQAENGYIEGSGIDSNASCSIYSTGTTALSSTPAAEEMTATVINTSGQVRNTSAEIKFY